jgi:hypothetical protein
LDKIEVSKSETDAQFIRQKLNEFNFNLVLHDNHELLNLIVRRQNTIIASLIGDTYWNWLYICLFWVDDRYSASGTDRTKIYDHLYLAEDCPISKELLPDFDSLFYEPFYQFMRQQFLAHEMEKAHELGADEVSLLHISPAHNTDFMRITSLDLQAIDISATRVWGKLVKNPGRFVGEYTENIFGNFQVEKSPELKEWWRYISERYGWVVG